MKKSILFFNIVFGIALAMLAFLVVNFQTPTTSLAEKEPEVLHETTVFDFVSFSQQDHAFTEEDFVTKTKIVGDEEITELYLYTTETITIYNFIKNNTDIFQVSVKDSNGLNLNINDYIHTITTKDENNEDITNDYYVFEIGNTDKQTQISVRYSQFVKNGFSTQFINYDFTFTLIQVAENFEIDPNLYWTYEYNDNVETIKSPTNGYTYPNLSLHIPNGTALNPITVKFKYLGANYEVYNIDGVFYNSIDDTIINNMSMLEFNLSGLYSVEIYDETINCSVHSNYLKHEFTIEDNSSRTSSFYITAQLEDGTVIMDQQIANDNTIVTFNNLERLVNTNTLDKITVTRVYHPTSGENIDETIEYSQRNGNLSKTLTLDKDGSFTIDVYNRNGSRITTFYVMIVKTIRISFQLDGKTYTIPEDQAINEIYTPDPIERTVTTYYNGLKGHSTYIYSISLANSAPSIDGIKDDARTQSNVSLTIRGVGNIQVVITKDGVTNPPIVVQNKSKIPTITEPGKYLVRITDEMGTTITKSFTITIKMNAAATALIVIGIAIVIVAIVAIIIMRTKIKVR